MSEQDDDDYLYWDREPVLIPVQMPVAVFSNKNGDVVIRQCGQWYHQNDPWIVLTPENARIVAGAISNLAAELMAPAAPLALPAPTPADRTAAERQRRYRERKRNGDTVTGSTVTPRARNGADLFPD